jgi:hypothetical protein
MPIVPDQACSHGPGESRDREMPRDFVGAVMQRTPFAALLTLLLAALTAMPCHVQRRRDASH